MSLKKALLAATMLSLPLAAQAQPVTGLYVGAGAGTNYLQGADEELRGAAANQAATLGLTGTATKINFNWGFAGVASLGYGFGNGFRAEVEGNFRWNEVDKISTFGNRLQQSGYVRQYGAMGNVLYDFSPYQFGLIGIDYVQPYLGIGAGYVWSEYDRVGGRVPFGPATGTRALIDDTGGSFAYQGIAGVGFPLAWAGVPGLTFTAEYRFLGTLENEYDATVRSPANVVVQRNKVEFENYNHSILLGVRYALNQPVPPAPVVAPAPAAAPAPARTYLVFFDFDRADLTDRARQIIGEAAQNSRRVQATRIEVAGHADRSGTPAYNQRLSQRRAEVVAAELVRGGVNRSDITVQAFGESRPLVPTADGVREPQNRRVEIVLR